MTQDSLDGKLSSTASWVLRMVARRLADDKYTGKMTLHCCDGGVTMVTYEYNEKFPKEGEEGQS